MSALQSLARFCLILILFSSVSVEAEAARRRKGWANTPVGRALMRARRADRLQALEEARKAQGRDWVDGFWQPEIAYQGDQAHYSKLKNRLHLTQSGTVGEVKWKLGLRSEYDAAYNSQDYYRTRKVESSPFLIEPDENYVDFELLDFDWRVGRQHIVWGELVGQFVADVNSARDLREASLPDLEILRIPQWAVLVEKYISDLSLQFNWSPYASFDKLPPINSDYFPFDLSSSGLPFTFSQQEYGELNFSSASYGAKLGYLLDGWDLSLFHRSGFTREHVLKRTIVLAPTPSLRFSTIHPRIDNYGMSISKDLSLLVLKTEAVWTKNAFLSVNDDLDIDGLVEKEVWQGAISLEPTFWEDGQLILQATEIFIPSHESRIYQSQHLTYLGILLNRRFNDSTWTPQVIYLHGTQKGDGLVRPSLTWIPTQNWQWTLGADFFDGQRDSVFGAFHDRDRYYTELRYSF